MASERDFWGRDISPPGPIKVDPDAIGRRAKVVREALGEAARVPGHSRAGRAAMLDAQEYASDEALAKLGRLLK